MPKQWEPWDDNNHTVTETDNGNYKCTQCGKLATAESLFNRFECEQA